METIGSAAHRALEQMKKDRENFRERIMREGSLACSFLEKKLRPLLRVVPPEVTSAELAEHERWELAEAARRLDQCARCPDGAAVCAGSIAPYVEGIQPGWDADKRRIVTHDCAKFTEHDIRRRLNAAGVPAAFLDVSFDTYNARHAVPVIAQSLQHAWDRARRRAADVVLGGVADNAQGITLVGGTGLGKSHLAVSILRAVFARSKTTSALFAYVPLFLDQIRSEYAQYGQSEVFDRSLRDRILVLDDLGAERPTDFAREKLELVVHHRWANRLPLIVTQNCSNERLVEAFGRPLVRRLMDASADTVLLEGEPYR